MAPDVHVAVGPEAIDEALKQQLIFFVGPDMTGKTQIAKETARRLCVPYFKATSEHETYLAGSKALFFVNQLKYADPRVIDILRQTGHSMVFDRGFPCEFAYSTVMRRQTDKKVLWWIDEQYAALGAKIVVCRRASYAGIVDDLDSSIKQETLEKLDVQYESFINQSQCRCLSLYVDDEDLGREVQDVLDFIATGFNGTKAI